MAIRCYIPTTLTALSRGLSAAHAVAPDAEGRALHGEELESVEFDALSIAAGLAAAASFESDVESQSARVVVAYDAPDVSPQETLTQGFDLIRLAEIDMRAVASFHLDEDEIWNEAARLADDGDRQAAEDHLGDSDLLWYDASELSALLSERGSD